MAVSDSYREFVIERLNQVEPVHFRKMFGGIGIYSGDHFFAIISDDVLYFKVDDETRKRYSEQGMGQFSNMGYFELPADALEDEELLTSYMREAIDVAARSKSKKKK